MNVNIKSYSILDLIQLIDIFIKDQIYVVVTPKISTLILLNPKFSTREIEYSVETYKIEEIHHLGDYINNNDITRVMRYVPSIEDSEKEFIKLKDGTLVLEMDNFGIPTK